MQRAITRFLSPHQPVSPWPRSTVTKSSDTRSIQAVFQKTKFEHDCFAQEAEFFGFWESVYPGHRRLVLAYTVDAFVALGCDLRRMDAGDPIPPIEVIPQHRKLLHIFLQILEDESLIEKRGDNRVRTSTPADKAKPFVLLKNLGKQFPQHATTHRLIAVTGSHLADCLCGDVDPLRLIFGDNRDLLEDVYTSAPLFAITTKHLDHFLSEAYRNTKDHIEILKIGAGVGGTTKHLIEVLNHLRINFTYTFTDVSALLVSLAEKKFSHISNHRMKFQVLDVEKTPPAKLHGYYHTIISTNCIHATHDITKSTSNIKKMFRPGGFLTLAELTLSLHWYELVFGLLEGWWLFDDGRKHALADEVFWEERLKRAGFQDIAWTRSENTQRVVARLITAFNV